MSPAPSLPAQRRAWADGHAGGVHSSTHGPILATTLQKAVDGAALGLKLSCITKVIEQDTKATGCIFITGIDPEGVAALNPRISVGVSAYSSARVPPEPDTTGVAGAYS